MKISFVIPNYNGEALLKKNLPRVISFAKQYASRKENHVEIIVTDDYSSDGSEEVMKKILQERLPERVSLQFITSDKNRGFSSNVNKGAKRAIGEVIVLLNTDVYPESGPEFLSKIEKYFHKQDFFALGFMDRSIEDDGSVVLRGRGVGKWRRGFLVHSKGETNKTSTLWVSGGSSAFRKTIWDKLGGMNEIYNPFYWEDIDLSYRAIKSGFSIAFDPSCVVVHEHEKGSIRTSKSPFAIQKIAYRNQFIFVWLNVTDSVLLLTHILWIPFHILNTLLRGDVAFTLGFMQAIRRLPSVLEGRRKLQHQFRRTDREVTAPFQDDH